METIEEGDPGKVVEVQARGAIEPLRRVGAQGIVALEVGHPGVS